MSSQKYTLTKNMDQQPLISEKISNQSSMKENLYLEYVGNYFIFFDFSYSPTFSFQTS